MFHVSKFNEIFFYLFVVFLEFQYILFSAKIKKNIMF